MMHASRFTAGFAAALMTAASLTGCSSDPDPIDLGKVLDRTVIAMEGFSAQLTEGQEVGDAELNEFTLQLAQEINANPQFYSSAVGVALQEDASFHGFADANNNGAQDSGENKLFTLEIDHANQRIIATDTSGNGVDARPAFMGAGAGFLAGMLLGSMMSRQSAAGVPRNSFNNRQTTSRSSYTSPSSARSRARSGGSSRGK